MLVSGNLNVPETTHEIYKKGSEDMFYYSKNSRNKVIHVRGCHYIKNTNEDMLGDFKTIAAAYREGYNPCHHCSNILKLYRKEKKKILNQFDYRALSQFILKPQLSPFSLRLLPNMHNNFHEFFYTFFRTG